MKLRTVLATALLLLGLVVITPTATAAPTVLPVSSSAYAVTTSDYLEIPGGGGITTMGTPPILPQFKITAPNGNVLTLTRNPTTATTTMSDTIRFRLDGVQVGGPGEDYATSGNLIGSPGDGSWLLEAQYQPYGLPASYGLIDKTFVIGTKTLIFDGTASPTGQVYSLGPVYWNWRSSGTTTTMPRAAADQIAMAEFDPNNAVFFSDTTAPDVSPFTAYTLNYGAIAGCPTTTTSTVNGAWLGATGTAFSQFIYRDGNFLGTADLRSIVGYATTTEENEGATPAGTDAKSIPYNNAAGTSYQFKVRDDMGEALGVVQWIPSGLCAATIPSILNLLHDENEFQISASQAQCSEDAISFEITLFALGAGSGIGSINVGLYGAGSGTPRIDIVKAQMFLTGTFPSQVYSFERVMPPGAYVALATADLTGGVGINDYFDAVAFNVPREACGDLTTDLSPVLLAIESSRLNLTSYLDHVDAQLHALDANLTTTRGEILNAIESLNVTIIGNVTGNFTLDNATLTSIYNELIEHRAGTLELNAMSFDGLNFDGSFLVLLWLLALLWCLRNGKLLAATAATVGIGMVLVPGPEYIGWVGVLLFTIALWLEAIGMEKIYAKWWQKVKNNADTKNP